VPLFILACLTDCRPVIHGDGEQARDFTFVDDVVRANLLAAEAPEPAWGRALLLEPRGVPTIRIS
jgi:nucleoside-diphosphate-sugar epimerase